jgi:SAM-dependent methyltransferase
LGEDIKMNREEYIINRFNVDTSKPAPYYIKLSRWKELPHMLAEMKCNVGVEVGTEGGKYAECLLRKMPRLTLDCIDCWESYDGYREKMVDQQANYYLKAQEKLSPHQGRFKLIKRYSMDAVKDYDNNSVDFVYIDGNHNFVNVANDIAEWSKKVKPGGIILGHDFTHNNVGYERTDVDYVVRAWTQAHDIKTWFVTEEGDRCPTWMWIKH